MAPYLFSFSLPAAEDRGGANNLVSGRVYAPRHHAVLNGYVAARVV